MTPRSGSLPQLILRLLPIITILAGTGGAIAGQQPKVMAPHKPIAPKMARHREWDPPRTAQAATGGLWLTDGNFRSTLYLNNMLKEDAISVTPVIHLANGVAHPLAPVTLEGSGTAAIDINAGLAKHGVAGYATLSGYVEVQYGWGWAAVCGSVWNVDVQHSLIFVYPLRPAPSVAPQKDTGSGKEAPKVLEGLWWKQESSVTGFIAFSNVTARALRATVEVLDAENRSLGEHSVTVSPHGTKLIDLSEIYSSSASTGGLLVTHEGRENELVVNASLKDPSAGYSARLPLMPRPDASAATSHDTFAELGLMVGPSDPMMAFPASVSFAPYSLLRNVSEQQVSVGPTIWWMEGGQPQSAALPQVALAPHQTQQLDLPALLTAAGLKDFRGNIHVVLESSGPKGALLAASGSVDQSNTYVFEVIPRGVSESVSKGLQYWSTANGDDTMVSLWNPADEAQDFVFTLSYPGGHYGYPIHLEARATQTFNISEIIHAGIPDAEGNVIPTAIQAGSAEISGSQGESEHILVAMESGIYNVRKATCGSLECANCTGIVTTSILLSPFAVTVGGTKQETFTYQYNTGTQYDVTTTSNWSSSNTSIATVSQGLTTGVSVGAISISSTYPYLEPGYTNPCAYNAMPPCPNTYHYPTGSAPGGGVPRIDSILPSTGTTGKTLAVVIKGAGFGSAPTVNVSGTGIAVTLGTGGNNSTINASFAIAPNAGIGAHTVTVSVTAPDSSTQLSNGVTFNVVAVAIPTDWTILSETPITTGINANSLFFRYSWSSSTGNLADLSTCTVGESVFYPNFPNTPYIWPLPMVASTVNPGTGGGKSSGSGGYAEDTNQAPDGFQQPYFGSSFTATQRFWWQCPYYNNGSQNNFVPDFPIVRKVFKDTDGFWKYQITKSGYSYTLKLPNQ